VTQPPTDPFPGLPSAGSPAPLIVPKPKPTRSTSVATILLSVAVLIAAAGVAFAAGRVTAPTPTAARGGLGGNFARSSFGAFGPGASFGAGGAGLGGALTGGGVSLSGTVTAINGTTMTLQLASGQTVTVDLSGSTTYHTATTADASAVTPGSTVKVEVSGLDGGRGAFGARASGAPSASGGTGVSASDVTVEAP